MAGIDPAALAMGGLTNAGRLGSLASSTMGGSGRYESFIVGMPLTSPGPHRYGGQSVLQRLVRGTGRVLNKIGEAVSSIPSSRDVGTGVAVSIPTTADPLTLTYAPISADMPYYPHKIADPSTYTKLPKHKVVHPLGADYASIWNY
jgi:hypothetical protein